MDINQSLQKSIKNVHEKRVITIKNLVHFEKNDSSDEDKNCLSLKI